MSQSCSSRSGASLDRTAKDICEKFGGRWSGIKGMCRCPAHDDRTPSLAIGCSGNAILFHCFAGCTQEEVLAGLGRHGIAPHDLFAGTAGGFAVISAIRQSEQAPSRNALRLWRQAQFLKDTPAKAYLEARSVRASSSELRFHPRTPLGPKGAARFLPAIIAAVRTDEGVIAIHRTFLDRRRPEKAKFAKPKRALGKLGAGAVRLFDAKDGKLGLAEGIESAMSARALTGIPCWATLGNERFGIAAVPESVTELHLFVDADRGGQIAAGRGFEAYAADGRIIRVRRPSVVGSDWNDALTAWLASRKP